MDPLDPLTQPLSAHPMLSQSDSAQASTSSSLPASIPFEPPTMSTQAAQSSVSAFATAQDWVARSNPAVVYQVPPPYVPPRQVEGAQPSGRVGDGRWTILEEGKVLDPKAKVVGKLYKSEDIAKMSVAELKKRGLGRVPSGFCYSSRMTLHQPLPSEAEKDSENPHPEQPTRILGVWQSINEAGLTSRMVRVAVREAIRDEVLLVHSEGHWDRVRGTSYQSLEYLTTCAEYFDRLSLYVNQESAICARLSCGGVIEMCKAVAEGQIRNGFAIVRPPGHHAEPEDAMGFCFFNNAAVAAKWLRTIYNGEAGGEGSKAIKKVLIVDWDVHHGNGTQKAFWDDPNVLYISLHRHDRVFYPGGTYGDAEMVGGAAGTGFSVNIPFPEKGMGDADYIYAFQQVVMPIAYEFAPDFVIVSAGYDAADGDRLGEMKVSPAGFAHMTHMLSVLADGKLVLALEGGYNVDAVARSAHACIEVLVGDEPRHLRLEQASPSATNAVHEVKLIQAAHWKSMGQAVEGLEELKTAGRAVPISEILKAHRTYDLYHLYRLFNIEFARGDLEDAYRDQLLCTENVYECETLMIFMHDLGGIKASFSASTFDVNVEKTMLIDTSSLILDWAIKENDWGVVDVNFLAHLPTQKGQPPEPGRDKALEQQLAIYIWDNIVEISEAKNVILFGSGCGCSALMAIVQNRAQVKQRVKACVSVLGLEPPPELEASSGVRPWYKENSLVLLPSTHVLHEDARRAGKHQKKFGNVLRMTSEDESRPIHLLKASLPTIKTFIGQRVPLPVKPKAIETETSMSIEDEAAPATEVDTSAAPLVEISAAMDTSA